MDNLLHINTKSIDDRPFYVGKGHILTYKDAIKKIEKITALFKRQRLQKDDRIAIMSDNDLETSLLFLSAIFNGITVTVIDRKTKKLRLNSILELFEPTIFFIDKAHIQDIQNPSQYTIYTIENPDKNSLFHKFFTGFTRISSKHKNYFQTISTATRTQANFRSDIHDTAYVLFTSGTTSEPKGVEISYFNLSEHLKTLQKVYQLDNGSHIFNILELSHADGIIQGPVLSFFSNIPLHRPFRFKINKIEKILHYIHDRSVTHFITTPTMLSLINQFGKEYAALVQKSSLTTIGSAGALLEAPLWNDFQQTFKKNIINVYGLTESVAGGLFTRPGNPKHIGTIGTPVDCQAKIVDKHGNELEDGQVGELLLSGTNIMKGYYKNEEATLKVLRDGWLHTGDLAYQKEGIFTIAGRIKNVILTGGFTVYPEEITTLLNTHPLIQESVVFGIPHPTWGEEIIAVIVKKEHKLDKISIMEYCREHLEPYKVPKKIHFVKTLPRGRSGKVIIPELRKMLDGIQAEKLSLEKEIFKLASKHFFVPLEQINRTSSPDTISAWDSLGHLEFIALLESHYNIAFSTVEMMKIEDLDDIIQIIKEKIL